MLRVRAPSPAPIYSNTRLSSAPLMIGFFDLSSVRAGDSIRQLRYLMNLNHVHIAGPNVEELKNFYEKYFGFRKHFNHGKGYFLTNDAGYLLAIDPIEQNSKPIELPEWFHLGFCLKDPKEVVSLYEKMKDDSRVKFARELKKFEEEAVNFYCYDPAGFKIEVSWNREK